jgi:hypothetical protein
MLTVVLYLIAAICFALAALNVDGRRVNLVAVGLLAWVLVPLIGAIQ